MDDRLLELHLRRERLRERIRAQRVLLARDLAPVATALGVADQGLHWMRRAKASVLAHPGVTAAVLVGVLVWRPRWVLRSLRWGLLAWRGWRDKGQPVSDLWRAFMQSPRPSRKSTGA